MFKKTRIKLTISYLLIVIVITLTFSVIIYTGVDKSTKFALRQHEQRLENRLRDLRRPPELPPKFQEEYIQEAILEVREDTINLLIGMNTVIWFLTGVFGYWFAGKTLSPIEGMTKKQKKFIEDAAHELKTPLTSIKTQLEVNLRNKKFEKEKIKQLLESTIEDIDELNLLTNSLIRQSKYQSYENTREELDFTKLVISATTKFSGRIEEKSITLEKELEDIKLHGDSKALTELLNIILDNAIKFNLKKGKVIIELRKTSNNALLKITDTGIGIDSENIPHVFDRFFKVDNSRTKQEHDGFGLGLSIAKEIVVAHKGDISITSTINKGTAVTIKLPL